MDLAGRFLRKSLQGNEYILVGYHYDANYNRAILIKNRRGPIITEAWKKVYYDFQKVVASPKTYILDNEKSKDLLEIFKMDKIAY